MNDQIPTGDYEPTPESGLSQVRAGDLDRRLALDILSMAMTQGHLSPTEYEERADKAIAARTFGELDALTDDLPSNQVKPQSAAVAPPVGADADVITNRIAVMSGSELKDRASVGDHLNAFALMGGIEIDLRDALFTTRSLTIRANAIMAGIEIVVPHNATVRIKGIGIMGGFGSEAGTEGPGDPEAPTIIINGVAIMAGVNVVRRPPKDPKPSLKKR